MRTPLGGYLLHPRVLDPGLLAQEKDLVVEPFVLFLEADPGVEVLAAQLRVWVMEVRAREIVWITAERTRRGQPLGRGSAVPATGCRAMRSLLWHERARVW